MRSTAGAGSGLTVSSLRPALASTRHRGVQRQQRRAGTQTVPRVDVGQLPADWAPIEEAWDDGHLPDDELEELFIEHVILEDMTAQEAEQWGFPGNDYTIVVEPA